MPGSSSWSGYDISENGRLYLEVAEDYAILAVNALRATQVKDTKESGAVTLNSAGVRKAITAFVDLVEKNPELDIDLHFYDHIRNRQRANSR